MNYGGGPYVLYFLLRIKEVMGQDLVMVNKVMDSKVDTTTTPIIKEVISLDIINTVIRVKLMDISRIQVVDVETVVLV